MGPRKSDISPERGYAMVLQRLCKEVDVLIIPEFITQYTHKQLKQKESVILEKQTTTTVSENKDDTYIDICGPLQPPKIYIVYEHPEEKEGPLAVICKNIYIEFTFINAFGKSLESYPTLTTLKIENCCVSSELVEAIALLLAEEHGKRITDLSLDGNENISVVLPNIISYSNGLKYLSLQRCSLDDEGIRQLAEVLGYTDEKEHKLLVLNLGMNKIGNKGVTYLANALRTNRTLVSLFLAGNQIGDEGIYNLTEVLMKFKLRPDEVITKRKRVFDKILERKRLIEKYEEEWKTKEDTDVQVVKSTTKRTAPVVKRIRGPDGKIRCLTSRDKKPKVSQGKINSGEKFLKQANNTEGASAAGIVLPPSEIAAIEKRVDSEISPDKHPFVNEFLKEEDGLWCHGCWSLADINLAYNYLTEKSLEEFSKVFNYQGENFKTKQGLHRVVLVPGNLFEESSDELKKLQSAIIHCNTKKETTRILESFPNGSSISSPRRTDSITRRTRNR